MTKTPTQIAKNLNRFAKELIKTANAIQRMPATTGTNRTIRARRKTKLTTVPHKVAA